jgi:hypothetical protein
MWLALRWDCWLALAINVYSFLLVTVLAVAAGIELWRGGRSARRADAGSSGRGATSRHGRWALRAARFRRRIVLR